jgi:hypothetical protein
VKKSPRRTGNGNLIPLSRYQFYGVSDFRLISEDEEINKDKKDAQMMAALHVRMYVRNFSTAFQDAIITSTGYKCNASVGCKFMAIKWLSLTYLCSSHNAGGAFA